MYVGPVVFTKSWNLLSLAMWCEVDDLCDFKLDVIIVLKNVDFLTVIHYEQALLARFFHVIGREFSIVFECNKPATSKLENLFIDDLIGLWWMEL